MMRFELKLLPRTAVAVMMRARMGIATFAALCLWTQCGFAQQDPAAKRDDLDVTMQIIVDPDAKLPDEVVRRIPLPAPKPQDPAAGKQTAAGKDQPAAADNGQERAREAQELGRDIAEGAKQKAKEAAEQREEARRSDVKNDQVPRGNPDPPGRPPRPPGR
jgi:hypothetical protein